MKKLVIFDLDGTLVNSIEDLAHACNHALTEMGYAVHSVNSYSSMVGNGISKLIERALPEEARRQRVIEAMRTKFIEYYDRHLYDFTVPYPGIPQLLEELHRRDIALAVASNKYQKACEEIVKHLFPQVPWASIHGQRDLTPLKPDPSMVFEILLDHPTPKTDVIYVGDSGIDMETAYRACIDKIGVTWGYRTRNELLQYHPEYIVSDPDEILSIVMK